MPDLELLRPASLAEAASVLRDRGDDAHAIAGGTAIVLMLRNRLISPAALVSLDRVADHREIRHEPGLGLRIGALVRLREIERSEVVRSVQPTLAEAVGRVANVRVRNQATLGGNLAEADYASDPPAVLLALGASVRTVSDTGGRSIPPHAFFRDFYETALESGELIAEMIVPDLPPGTRGTYLKFLTRSSEDRPCVGVAAFLRRAPDGAVDELRVAVGAVAAIPQRFPDIERQAAGRPADRVTFEAVADAYAEAIDPLDDFRGSARYRTRMIRVLVRRALESLVRDQPA